MRAKIKYLAELITGISHIFAVMSVALPKPIRVFVTGAGGRTGQLDVTGRAPSVSVPDAHRWHVSRKLLDCSTATLCAYRTSGVQQTQIQTGTVCSKGACQASVLRPLLKSHAYICICGLAFVYMQVLHAYNCHSHAWTVQTTCIGTNQCLKLVVQSGFH